MDYKELLKKYINHVGNEEGCDFIYNRNKPELFTQEEWDEPVLVN